MVHTANVARIVSRPRETVWAAFTFRHPQANRCAASPAETAHPLGAESADMLSGAGNLFPWRKKLYAAVARASASGCWSRAQPGLNIFRFEFQPDHKPKELCDAFGDR
jgi:hypothetical protein